MRKTAISYQLSAVSKTAFSKEESSSGPSRITHYSSLSNHGVALMMVLWVLVFMSILSVNFLKSTRWTTGSTHNLKEETVAYYLALSGYEEAMHYLSADKDPAVDYIDEEGNFWTDNENIPVTGKVTTEEGELDIKITDESSRVNINFANQDRLQKLLQQAGVAQDDIMIIIDSIIDWKDPDKEHHLSGAEDDYYEGLEEPYTAKNALFSVPEELVLVKGMKPEYLFGDGTGTTGLLSMITTFGNNTVNINTASKEIMQLLGLNEVEIETILKQRNKAYGGFRFIPQQFSAKGLNTMATQFFRIEVTARTKNSPIGASVTGIVIREASTKGSTFKTIYWRERAETVRT